MEPPHPHIPTNLTQPPNTPTHPNPTEKQVSLQDMDKNGVALGHISVLGGSGERVPFGLELTKRGLARVDDRGTTALPIAFANALQAAQAEARAAKRGIWCVGLGLGMGLDLESAPSDVRPSQCAAAGRSRRRARTRRRRR